MILFIDTHESKKFSVALKHNEHTVIVHGQDPSVELIDSIEQAKEKIQQQITNDLPAFSNIIFACGPGSLTGLRIGSSFALGLALGSNAKIQSISIWDLLLANYPNTEIFFYTGTKKWIHKTSSSEKIIEINDISNNYPSWISNNTSKLENILDMNLNTAYPNMIELMLKYQNLSSNSLDLIYNIDLFEL